MLVVGAAGRARGVVQRDEDEDQRPGMHEHTAFDDPGLKDNFIFERSPTFFYDAVKNLIDDLHRARSSSALALAAPSYFHTTRCRALGWR